MNLLLKLISYFENWFFIILLLIYRLIIVIIIIKIKSKEIIYYRLNDFIYLFILFV
jgi:hypothetical protein